MYVKNKKYFWDWFSFMLMHTSLLFHCFVTWLIWLLLLNSKGQRKMSCLWCSIAIFSIFLLSTKLLRLWKEIAIVRFITFISLDGLRFGYKTSNLKTFTSSPFTKVIRIPNEYNWNNHLLVTVSTLQHRHIHIYTLTHTHCKMQFSRRFMTTELFL